MRILITGGTGFVGLATAEVLLAAGHEVTLFAASDIPERYRGAGSLNGANILIGDICDEAGVGAAVAKARPQAVLHLAAMTPDKQAEREIAARIIGVNVGGTATLLKVLSTAPDLKRVVCTSSVAVYGHVAISDGPIFEDHMPLSPMSLYGITKVAAEQTALRLSSLYGLDLRIARLGPLFGPWEYHTGVRPLLSPHAQVLHQWRAGYPAKLARPLLGDWLYSRDAAEGLRLLLDTTTLNHTIYNVGAGASATILDWARGFSEATSGHGAALAGHGDGPNVTVSMADDRAHLSIDRLSQDTGYTPQHHGKRVLADHAAWLSTYEPLPKRIST